MIAASSYCPSAQSKSDNSKTGEIFEGFNRIAFLNPLIA